MWGESFWVRARVFCLLLLSVLRPPPGLDLCSQCACYQQSDFRTWTLVILNCYMVFFPFAFAPCVLFSLVLPSPIHLSKIWSHGAKRSDPVKQYSKCSIPALLTFIMLKHFNTISRFQVATNHKTISLLLHNLFCYCDES